MSKLTHRNSLKTAVVAVSALAALLSIAPAFAQSSDSVEWNPPPPPPPVTTTQTYPSIQRALPDNESRLFVNPNISLGVTRPPNTTVNVRVPLPGG